MLEHTHGVGRDLQARADLPELRRLLVELNADAFAQQRARGGGAPDTAADDNRFHAQLPV
jgi:hypothetical protein